MNVRRPPTRDMARINKLVIHCSATTAKMTDVDAAWIDREHRKRGWAKIGYHYVIRRDGALEPGRALEEIGAHARGHNAYSIGICMVGGLDAGLKPENNFTPEQWATLASLVGELHRRYPKAEVLGHRDLPKVAKACPCFDVKPWFAKAFLPR